MIIIEEPELILSANGRFHLTVTNICTPAPSEYDHFQDRPQRPVSEAQYKPRCATAGVVYVAEFAALNDDGSWRILWSRPLPEGSPAAGWVIDDQGRFLVVNWRVGPGMIDRLMVFSGAGDLLHNHDLATTLSGAGLFWLYSEYERDYWSGSARFSDDGLSLRFTLRVRGGPTWLNQPADAQATLSLADGQLTATDLNQWHPFRQELDCARMVRRAEITASDPQIEWDDQGHGKWVNNSAPERMWNRITTRLSADTAPVKANILFRLGISCGKRPFVAPP
ncbi:hypothetical protein [Niveispirillum sp. KHB5.9]|uniref:hypothetical protein n=1 Tax=Niveispirillum sp. KHB5.9 TaxID=3400269 RepID=UPI003A84E034